MDFPKTQEDIINSIHHRVDSSSSTSVTTNTFTQAASHPGIILNTNESNKVIPALQNGVCNVLTSTCSSQPNTGFTSLVQGSNGSIILISQPVNKTANIPVSIALRNGHGPAQLQNVDFKKDVEIDTVSSEQVTFKVPATPSVQFSVTSGENNHSENLKPTFLLNTCQSQATYIQPEQKFIAPTVSSPFTVVDPSNANVASPEQCQLPVVNMHSPTEKTFTHNSSVTNLQGLNVFINSSTHLNSNASDPVLGVNPSVAGKRIPDNTEVSPRPQLILPSDMSSFSSLAYNASPTKECDLTSGHVEKTSMLHTLLTSGDMGPEKQIIRVSSPTSVCSPLSPEINTDSQSGISSPIAGVQLFDSNTQSTLISKSERLQLDSESTADFGDFNWDISSDDERKKAFKSQIHSDAPSSILETEDGEKAFEAGSAVSTSEFTFRKFGADVNVPGVFTFGTDKENQVTSCNSVTTLRTVPSIQMDPIRKEINQEVTEIMSIQTAQPSHLTRSRTQKQRVKEPSLNQRYPMKLGGYELRIVEQPEEQHRARYLTEGSRGAVKNRSGDGHITLKMFGKADSAVLQVFVGTDSGCIKPHGFYQACKVCGKNSTPCRERDIDGTTVIEMDMEFGQDMTTTVDNVGILKLRNADVEQRIGLVKAKRKSTKARLVFRAIIQKPDGNVVTLQIASDTILCTQPVGQPEICKISLHEAPVSGGGELFLIGKNFMKGTKVFFQQLASEEGETVWEETAEIDKDYFQPTHLICTIPKYQDPLIMEPVKVQIVVSSAGKLSDPQQFVYTPVLQIKREIPMETDQCQKRITPFTAAPEALELNNQIQQSQQVSPSGMFQLPPGTISTLPSTEVTNMQVDTSPMPQATPPPSNQQESDSSQLTSTSFVNRQVTEMEHEIGNLAATQIPSENILGNILQEAKQDHPHDNIDKMVEAILNEKWQETEHNTQKQEQDQQIQQQQQQQFQQQDQLQCQLQQQKEQLQQCQQLQQQQLHQQQEQLKQQQLQQQEQLQQQQQQLGQQQGQLQQQQLQQQQEQLQQQQQEQLQQQQQLQQHDQLQRQQIQQQQEQLQQQQQLHQQEQLKCQQIQEQLLQQQIHQQQQQFQQHQQIQQQHLQQQDQFQQQHLKQFQQHNVQQPNVQQQQLQDQFQQQPPNVPQQQPNLQQQQLQDQFQQHSPQQQQQQLQDQFQQQPNVQQQPNLQQQQQLQDQFQQHSAQQQLQDKINIQQDQLQQQQIKQQFQHQKEELSPQSITQTHTSPSHPSVTFQVSSIVQQPASQLLQTAALQQQAQSSQQNQSGNIHPGQTGINQLQPNTTHSTGSLLQNLNYQIGPSSSPNVPSSVGPNFTSGTSGMVGSTMIIKPNSDATFRGADATNNTKIVIPDVNSLPNGAIQSPPTVLNPQSSGATAIVCNSPSQAMNQLSSDKANGSHSIVILHVNPSTQVESVLRSVLGSLDQQRGQS